MLGVELLLTQLLPGYKKHTLHSHLNEKFIESIRVSVYTDKKILERLEIQST